MLTLDANIWVAAFDPADQLHAASVEFLSDVAERSLELHSPAFLLVEVACAVARRARDHAAGEKAIQRLRRHPTLFLHPVDAEMLTTAAEIGVRLLIRGADALYVATATSLSTPLVSWDAELIQRGGATSPAEWMVGGC